MLAPGSQQSRKIMSEPPVHVSADEVHVHPHKTGHSRLDLVIALSAIFISAVSLVVAIEHGRTERDLVAANSWPFLRQVISNSYNGGKDVVIGVSNGGVGPAKLHSLEVSFDGRPVSSALDLLRKCCALRSTPNDIRRQLPNGLTLSVADESVLRPGEEDKVVVVHRNAIAPDVPARFAASLPKIGFRACYCSVLDECWVSDLRSTSTQRVRECRRPEHPFDPNGN